MCLDADDYEQLAGEGKKRLSLEKSVVVAEKDEEIKSLRLALASAAEENKVLASKRSDLRGKVGIQDAQEVAWIDRLRKERLQWAALTPVAERLIREAPAGKTYTMPDTERRLWLEVPALTLCVLLGAGLSGWGLLALAEKKITTLHREITTLSERKETLEVQSARIWATFKGLEPYRDQTSKDYLLTPEGWTISYAGTVGKQDAWRIVRK